MGAHLLNARAIEAVGQSDPEALSDYSAALSELGCRRSLATSAAASSTPRLTASCSCPPARCRSTQRSGS